MGKKKKGADNSGEGDQACELECVKQDNTLQEFEGPVKLLIVEPPIQDLTRRIWMAALLNFANILIGAVVMITFYYSYICKLPMFISTHIAACTCGFQMFLPSAILMLNPNFGGATQLKNRHRKAQHAYLVYVALMFGITGGLHIWSYLMFNFFPYNAHSITGAITMLLAIPTFFLGPLLYYTDQCTPKQESRLRKVKYVHAALGVATFVASSICLCTSFLKPTFQKWSMLIGLRELAWVLSAIVLIYTIIVVKGVGWKMRYYNTREVPQQ